VRSIVTSKVKGWCTALALGVRVISGGRQNTAPANVFIDDHRNISLVKERVKPRLNIARAAMRVIGRVGSPEAEEDWGR
jgi:hypothetical protein